MNNSPAEVHPAFSWVRSQSIESLNITIEEYQHNKTGAMHYHMHADNTENVFLVALRTVPMDSTGVAHILEHTALCGSEKYPVRDPFFMMIRRSLNTFMNAFTSSDWTAYPFASQNRKDFNNLMDVYLDAVFFSRLDPLDFAQEGHRVEFAEADNPESDLVFKGVVFNEMKGAMSSITSTLWQTLCTHLYPTTTYHYNSGGEPKNIPDLSYEQLKAFYKTHYHPSNAFFMTYGDIPAIEHHKKFEEQALSKFDRLDEQIAVGLEQRFTSPIQVTESYAFDEEGSAEQKSHIVLGWLLGESTNLEELFNAQLLSSVLLDNSASPLQMALETTDLGSAPSPLCGLEDSMRELTFVCGLAGSDPDKAEAVEQLILSTIEKVANEGAPYEQVAAVLHQLELHQREVGGDGYPYGLQLILSAMGNATHRGDPIAALDIDPVLDQLRENIKDPEFIKQLAKSLLLDNQHRLTLVMQPDTELSSKKTAEEAERLAKIKSELSDDEKQQIIQQAKDLVDRQNQIDDESVLPKVGLEDIPKDIQVFEHQESAIKHSRLKSYIQGTNGLVYQQIIIEMPALNEDELKLLPYYTNMLTELGIGDFTYLETQAKQASVCGGINAFSTMRGSVEDEQVVKAYIVLSSKALSRNASQQTQLMYDTLNHVRFDELPRIRELISQQRIRKEQSVTSNGHGLAMTAASSGMSPYAKLSHQLSGLMGIQTIKALDDSLNEEQALQDFASNLSKLHEKVANNSKQFLLVADEDSCEDINTTITQQWSSINSTDYGSLSLETIREQQRQLWIANTQVNFCAKSYPTVPVNHPDAAPLTVMGGFLRNGFLHRAIREQGGAYGGGASQDTSAAAFRFFSYRDPRLAETLDDFDASIQWLIENDHKADQLEQAILGVISSLDKPSSPAGEAKQDFHNQLFGRTIEQRRAFRAAILQVTIDDLVRCAKTYLLPEKASIAVITNQATANSSQATIDSLQLNCFTL